MVMDLLGKDLEVLSKGRFRYTYQTVLMIASQLLEILDHIHS